MSSLQAFQFLGGNRRYDQQKPNNCFGVIVQLNALHTQEKALLFVVYYANLLI